MTGARPMTHTVFTAANVLTMMRLALVPVFALFMLYGRPGWALVTFVAAGATDALDGLIARLTSPTTLGAWLDPMADKLLVTTMFVMLTLPGIGLDVRIPIWLTVLVVSRDIAIVLTVAIFNLAVARRTFRPSFLGKVATATYIITGVVTLHANTSLVSRPLVAPAVYVTLAVTLASGVEYLYRMAKRPVEVEVK
jgi:cardiolipin synthase